MGQFTALQKKNWILFSRNWVGSLVEVLLPLIFALLLGGIGRLKSVTEKTDYSYIGRANYTLPLFPTSFDNWNTAFDVGPDQKWIKDCGLLERGGTKRNRRGGKVGLAPDNALTRRIGAQLVNSGLETWYVASDTEMQRLMMSDPIYGTIDPATNTKWQFCFGITFVEHASGKYKYNLRFNQTGPARVDDHWDPGQEQFRA